MINANARDTVFVFEDVGSYLEGELSCGGKVTDERLKGKTKYWPIELMSSRRLGAPRSTQGFAIQYLEFQGQIYQFNRR